MKLFDIEGCQRAGLEFYDESPLELKIQLREDLARVLVTEGFWMHAGFFVKIIKYIFLDDIEKALQILQVLCGLTPEIEGPVRRSHRGVPEKRHCGLRYRNDGMSLMFSSPAFENRSVKISWVRFLYDGLLDKLEEFFQTDFVKELELSKGIFTSPALRNNFVEVLEQIRTLIVIMTGLQFTFEITQVYEDSNEAHAIQAMKNRKAKVEERIKNMLF